MEKKINYRNYFVVLVEGVGYDEFFEDIINDKIADELEILINDDCKLEDIKFFGEGMRKACLIFSYRETGDDNLKNSNIFPKTSGDFSGVKKEVNHG